MFTGCTPFVGGTGGRSGGSSHSGGGTLRRSGGVVVVGEEFVDEGPATGNGGLRSLRIRSPFVKPAEGGGGSSLVGLGEREVPGRSLMTVDEAFVPRKRRTPFILPTGLEATVG